MLQTSRILSAVIAPILISILSATGLAQTPASIKELSKRTVKMPAISDCAAQGICDLKSVSIVERKLKVLLPDERAEFASYMTDFRFVVEVDNAASIPNYGIIQFMKGLILPRFSGHQILWYNRRSEREIDETKVSRNRVQDPSVRAS